MITKVTSKDSNLDHHSFMAFLPIKLLATAAEAHPRIFRQSSSSLAYSY